MAQDVDDGLVDYEKFGKEEDVDHEGAVDA